jgi:hypothetical protein
MGGTHAHDRRGRLRRKAGRLRVTPIARWTVFAGKTLSDLLITVRTSPMALPSDGKRRRSTCTSAQPLNEPSSVEDAQAMLRQIAAV